MTAPTKDLRPPLSSSRRRLAGTALLVIMVLVVAFCIANFNKSFRNFDTVTLQADAVGNQLGKQADVKVRGIIIGEVTSVESDGQRATVELAIDPDAISTIPSNTTAMFIPKTLFGERYVSLSIPSGPKARPLQDGDVITQDRSKNATETEKVLDNLLPVLTAVQPQKLSDTLGAISTALEGRGGQVGQTLVTLNSYLEGVNPQLPNLIADLQLLAPVGDIYTAAVPDLVAALDNLVTTSRTLVEERAALESTFRTVTSASDTTTAFLAQNRAIIIQLAATARPVLQLLATYSPELPCLFRQLTDLTPKINEVLRPDTGIQITVEIIRNRGKFVPSDAPEYADKRGPRCYDIQGKVPQDPPDGPLRDGAAHPSQAEGPFISFPNLPSYLFSGLPGANQATTAAGALPGVLGDSAAGAGTTTPDTGAGATGTEQTTPQAAGRGIDPANLGVTNTPDSPEERQLVTEVTALQMGVTPAQVPAFAPYLTAATMRGVPVTVR